MLRLCNTTLWAAPMKPGQSFIRSFIENWPDPHCSVLIPSECCEACHADYSELLRGATFPLHVIHPTLNTLVSHRQNWLLTEDTNIIHCYAQKGQVLKKYLNVTHTVGDDCVTMVVLYVSLKYHVCLRQAETQRFISNSGASKCQKYLWPNDSVWIHQQHLTIAQQLYY